MSNTVNPLMVMLDWYEKQDELVQERLSTLSNHFLDGFIIPEYVKSFSEVDLSAPAKIGERFDEYHESTEDYILRNIREFKTAFAWDSLDANQIVQRTFLLRSLISYCLRDMDTNEGWAKTSQLFETVKRMRIERDGVSVDTHPEIQEDLNKLQDKASFWMPVCESWKSMIDKYFSDDKLFGWHVHIGPSYMDYGRPTLREINTQFESVDLQLGSIQKKIKKGISNEPEEQTEFNTLMADLEVCLGKLSEIRVKVNDVWDGL